MSGLQLTQALRFKGVKSDWLDSLPDAGTEMLTISSTGVVSRQAIPTSDDKLPLTGGTLTGTLTAPEYRSPRAGSLSHVNPQNNIVLHGGFAGYGIGFDGNGELGTVVNSTLRSRLGQHLGLSSAGKIRFNSAADTSGSWDTEIERVSSTTIGIVQSGARRAQVTNGEITATNAFRLTDFNPATPDISIIRNATGPALELRSAGGVRIRTTDGSAAGALDAGAITSSAHQTINRSTFGSYGRYLVCNNESGYSEAELQQGLASGYGGTLTLRAGNLANTGYLRLRYDAGYCKLETNNNALTLAAGTAMMRLTDTYHDFHGNGGHWLTMDSQNFDKYNGTNPQTMRVFNTRTSATNFETLQTQWVSNEARIGTAVGSAGGTQRNVVLGSWNSSNTWTAALTIAPSGALTASSLSLTGTVTSGMQTLVADPSTVDITTGLNRMVKNSTTGEVRHWVNDGGTMKSVLFSP